MAPRGKKQRPKDAEEVAAEAASEEAKAKKGRRPLIFWVGPILGLTILSAAGGIWVGLNSRPPAPEIVEEEEVVAISIEELERQAAWVVPGLDLARERPAGRETSVMPMSVEATYPGRATSDYTHSRIDPRREQDLNRPMVVRVPSSDAIEMPVRDVAIPLEQAGNLEGAESLRPLAVSARPPGSAEPSPAADPSWSPRDPRGEVIAAPSVSTSPRSEVYTLPARDGIQDASRFTNDAHYAPRSIAPGDR